MKNLSCSLTASDILTIEISIQNLNQYLFIINKTDKKMTTGNGNFIQIFYASCNKMFSPEIMICNITYCHLILL